ncbi:response regulator transcription factor [Streptomyces sp. NBC_00878]|uniref:response regulator transcription factor n=1 Tax=Streptomyces sp. NBC_00878 TaxID=2975854 RepID=UPI002257F473|nr:response regulator transcription factor [Streptomyces sp. NBC_00878]MCX4907858.1 response regulator transcription factor [Streptomyces sp. NBC_00878]
MHLLMVEDDVRLAGLLCRGLADEGFEVDWAADGSEGLRRALSDAYDVIMLDVMLPGLHGYGVCAKVREAGNTTPILMLTAKAGEYDEAEGLETGADDYLAKPFSFVVLTARLKALVRRAGRPATAVLKVGDLRIEPVSLRCWRADEEVSLTTKEFAVLATLAERAGEVVTKTDIARRVWDEYYDGDLNVVEVYVSALRRKIDAPFGRRSIRTLRGAGYRLSADG